GAAGGMQKSLPRRQACHAIRSLRRIKMFPSGAVVTATGKVTGLLAPLILPGFENCAATSKTKRE
ncbi:hypothetical protein, partial [Stenotrophomonas sp. GbtcB23]|uniref:hypothetical protein n=1 Tax=Stenotrophomonas sp. GbtcB23 TaxID=2824768 RepID=UPI001C2FD75A